MIIVLHCGGIPFNGDTLKTRSIGGSETAAYYLARELVRQGHRVTMFTNSTEEGIFDGVTYVFAGDASEQAPLGSRFHQYAEQTLHDLLIVQRNPLGFINRSYAAKMSLLWLHDVALPETAAAMNAAMTNLDGVLVVSEWHKEQVAKVYDLDPNFVHVLNNAVDPTLFEGTVKSKDIHPILLNDVDDGEAADHKKVTFDLLYSSRPERGLELLVASNGIMECLAHTDPSVNYRLLVCGYDNTTPQMAQFYQYLWQRIEQLPNAVNLGPLTKAQLAATMRYADLQVYPSAFRETFCITAAENMQAGLPMLATEIGALPEIATLGGTARSGIELYTTESPGQFLEGDIAKFSEKIAKIAHAHNYRRKLQQLQREASSWYSWEKSAGQLLKVVEDLFAVGTRNHGAVCRHLMRTNDIEALRIYLDRMDKDMPGELFDDISASVAIELKELYGFDRSAADLRAHYAMHTQALRARGEEPYRRDDLNAGGNRRYETVLHHLSTLKEIQQAQAEARTCKVVDYGCYCGHYTIALAKRFPGVDFVGLDSDPEAIAAAKAWANDEKIENVEFAVCDLYDHPFNDEEEDALIQQIGALDFDVVLLGEVLEHVPEWRRLFQNVVTTLTCSDMRDQEHAVRVIITTPFGPWEDESNRKEYPFRFHLHHFERADLMDGFALFHDFKIACIPNGPTRHGDPLGSFMSTFAISRERGLEHLGAINYDRKFRLLRPRQTLTVCMIVKDAEAAIVRGLQSFADICDQLVICIDPRSSDDTQRLIEEFREWSQPGVWPRLQIRKGLSPLESGFDQARNASLEGVTTDWICWIDADEFFTKRGAFVPRLLRNNQFNGYAVRQQHFSTEPMGVIKTDLPVRIFRANKDIRFFGRVHEHPEQELNKGVGRAVMTPAIDIVHDGYEDEEIRRARFRRNIDLMMRDRADYPDRVLGKFLWIRDISLLSRFELEQTGQLVPESITRAREGVKLWQSLLTDALNHEEGAHERFVVESVQYYSDLNRILGEGLDVSLGVSIDIYGAKPENGVPAQGRFARAEDVTNLTKLIAGERWEVFGPARMEKIFAEMDKVSASFRSKVVDIEAAA